jgi:hypothetical protein
MITLSLNFEGARNANRGTQEQQIRDIIDTHLAFPGSEKLKLGVNIKNNGAASVSFTGPKEAIAEARRLWRENVKPAAAKVRRAAMKVRRATKPVKRKSVKKAATKKATPKVTTAKKAAKRVGARAKAKVSRKTSKKPKS